MVSRKKKWTLIQRVNICCEIELIQGEVYVHIWMGSHQGGSQTFYVVSRRRVFNFNPAQATGAIE